MAVPDDFVHQPAARRSSGTPLLIALGAIALFIGLAAYLRSVERSIAPAATIATQLQADGSPRPFAGVLRAVRAMKLVTVEIDSTVTATAEDESWRGDVSATLKAPVRFYYGTDLSGLPEGAFSFSPIQNEYVVRVPRPGRLATEVYPEAESPMVQVGWGRFRSRAGEYYIGQARRSLADRARAMTLSATESQKVEDATRDQVAALVRAIAGEQSRVRVIFEDEQPAAGPAQRTADGAAP